MKNFKSGFDPYAYGPIQELTPGELARNAYTERIERKAAARDSKATREWAKKLIEENDLFGNDSPAPFITELQKAVAFLASTRNPSVIPKQDPKFFRYRQRLTEVVRQRLNNLPASAEWERRVLQFELDKALATGKNGGYWGLQGLNKGQHALATKLEAYYRTDLPEIEQDFYHAHPKTIQLVGQYLSAKGYTADVMSGRDLLLTYKAEYKSNGGLTYFGDRRTPGLRQFALAEALRHPYELDPVVLGQKYERNKLRCIFMSSFADLFRYNRVIRGTHEALHAAPFVAWRGHHAVAADVREFCKARPGRVKCTELDVTAMDTCMRKKHMQTVKEVMSSNGCTQEWSEAFDRVTDAMFDIPVLAHSGWVKKTGHSLFSGLPPTNDFESYVTIDCSVRFVCSLKWKSGDPQYGREYMFVVLGDDILVLLDTDRLAEEYDDSFLMTLAATILRMKGMEANEEKQDVSDVGFFCKRFYPPHLDGSCYPIGMAANSFIHPRDGDPFCEDKECAVRFCQLATNVGRHPLRKHFLSISLEVFPFLRDLIPELSTADFDAYYRHEGKTSWEYLLTGEKLAPTSATVVELVSMIQNKAE